MRRPLPERALCPPHNNSNSPSQDATAIGLPEKTGYKMGPKPVPLEPFGHQVAGQASMLSVDPSTVCKPLIPREHHLYCTLPPQLIPFTPRYKGILYVQLEEGEDGCLNLWGYYPKTEDNHCPGEDNEVHTEGDQEDNDQMQPLVPGCRSGTFTPLSSGSELDMASALETVQSAFPNRPSSGCTVRLKQDGEYEVTAGKTGDSKFVIVSDDKTVSEASNNSKPSEEPVVQPLNPWGLSLHTRLLDKMRKSSHSASGCPFLVLENVVAQFVRPCILDLKVGSRLHGDDASQTKIASQSRKCNITTSRTLGLRLCGMQVYQKTTDAYKSLDKYFGRTLTDETFCGVLRDFLHNGTRFRGDLLAPILARLEALLLCLKELNSFRFYASSLLIMYDGLPSGAEQSSGDELKLTHVSAPAGERNSDLQIQSFSPASINVKTDNSVQKPSVHVDQESLSNTVADTALSNSSSGAVVDMGSRQDLKDNLACVNRNVLSCDGVVDVRMIDFAHTTHSGFQDTLVHEGPDNDYIWGLQNLTDMFLQLQREEHS